MHCEITAVIRAPTEVVYKLAAQTEYWPEILPHYRWVRIIEQEGNHRLVAMAAWRSPIPISWQATQEVFPVAPRITFRHTRGVTRGMIVEWVFTPCPDGVEVSIQHDLNLRWPLIGALVADWIIGPLFIDHVAGKTLRRIKELAEEAPSVNNPIQG